MSTHSQISQYKENPGPHHTESAAGQDNGRQN